MRLKRLRRQDIQYDVEVFVEAEIRKTRSTSRTPFRIANAILDVLCSDSDGNPRALSYGALIRKIEMAEVILKRIKALLIKRSEQASER